MKSRGRSAILILCGLWLWHSLLHVTRRVPSERPTIAATSITPITNVSGGASGFPYSGESYDVACTVTGEVTLYPAVYDDALLAWAVYQGYPCALDDSVSTKGTCIFPARTGSGLTWNAFKTGAGSVSACTAAGRAGPVPAAPRSGAGDAAGGAAVSFTAPLTLIFEANDYWGYDHSGGVATNAIAPWVAPCAGTLQQLQVQANTSSAGATVVTLHRSAGGATISYSPTGITCTASTAKFCADAAHTYTAAAGDLFLLRITGAGWTGNGMTASLQFSCAGS